jgi:hypothetical protein
MQPVLAHYNIRYYIDALVHYDMFRFDMMICVLLSRTLPDDGSVDPKHVVMH